MPDKSYHPTTTTGEYTSEESLEYQGEREGGGLDKLNVSLRKGLIAPSDLIYCHSIFYVSHVGPKAFRARISFDVGMGRVQHGYRLHPKTMPSRHILPFGWMLSEFP